MRIEVLICDSCGRGNDDDVLVYPYKIDKGCEMDPSGNGYNTDWEHVDYCNHCYKTTIANKKDIKISRR